MKKSTTFVALASSFTLAVCFVVIGSVSEELKLVLSLDNAAIGKMILGLFLSSVIVQIIIGPVIDKLGHKIIALIGFSLSALGFLLLSVASSFSYAVIASVFIGAGSTSLNTVANTLLPVVLFDGKDPARASSLGNGVFGIGLILTPILNSFITGVFGLSFNITLWVLTIMSLVFMIFAMLSSYPVVDSSFKLKQAFKLLKEKSVLIGAIALFCYIALESTMNTWIKPYMTEIFNSNKISNPFEKSGIVLGMFGASMMLGRFLISIIKDVTRIGSKIIFSFSILSVLMILLMGFTKNYYVAIGSIVAIGFAFAPLFPNIVGLTFSNFKPNLYGSIYGIILSIGLLGGTFVPDLIGKLSVGSTVQASLYPSVFVAVILIILSFFIKDGRTE